MIFDGNFWDVIPGGIAGAVAFYVYIKVIDYLKAPFISGSIRFIESFCVAFALGAGIVTVYYIVRLLGGVV